VSAQHHANARILNRRTLDRDHRVLAELLKPEMSVLDCGCGTAAITAGIAKCVGAGGRVVGLDRDESLLAIARREHGSETNLQFIEADICTWRDNRKFDIVSAARTLQWIADPVAALRGMRDVCLPGGLVVVLDYDHTQTSWVPEPPSEFVAFYRAFLAWREQNGWDNAMAAHLEGLFQQIGLREIRSIEQNEISKRGESDFSARVSIWCDVIQNTSKPLIAAGLCTKQQLEGTKELWTHWAETKLEKQVLALSTVVGRVAGRE
jgi:SAM-dependent methyltransferase